MADSHLSTLSIEIAGVRFNNPVLTASGTCGYGLDMAGLIDLNKLGGVCTKGLSAEPMRGNAPWRIVETHGGMLNAIGLQNIGARAFVEEKLPELRRYDTRVIPNVFGYTVEEYIEAIEILEDGDGIHGYELNISCPNVKAGGESFANDARQAAAVTEAVKRAATRPVIVKLSPNVTDVAAIARAVEAAGADALSMVNTAVGMAIDINTRRPRLANARVDTLTLARRLIRDEVPDCRLATLAARFRTEVRPTHRARVLVQVAPRPVSPVALEPRFQG